MRRIPKIDKVAYFLDKVWATLVPPQEKVRNPQSAATDEQQLLKAVEVARQEWNQARSYFDHVTDPDLVDYAIYEIEAAERKYMYLLRQAQRLGYAMDIPSFSGHGADEDPQIPVESAEVVESSEVNV